MVHRVSVPVRDGQGPIGPALRELARAPRNKPHPPRGAEKPRRLNGKEAGRNVVLGCGKEMCCVGGGASRGGVGV